MWCNLFFDKYANNHDFTNKITKNISISDLNSGNYKIYNGYDAYEYYQNKFLNTGYLLPDFLGESYTKKGNKGNKGNLYRLTCYTKTIKKQKDEIYTIISINTRLLENIVICKKDILHIKFLRKILQWHYHYTKDQIEINSIYFDNFYKIRKVKGNKD